MMFDFIVYSEATKASATAYISLDELAQITLYRADLNDSTISLTDSQLEVYIINASSILDNMFKLKGVKKDEEQSLEFPRDFEEDNIDLKVKVFVCYLVHQLITDPSIFYGSTEDNKTAQVKSETVGPLSTEYYELSSSSTSSLSITDKINSYYYSTMKDFIAKTRTFPYIVPTIRG